jgi:hypothetical protein
MTWLDETPFARRPLVIVEDHLVHTAEILDVLAAQRPDLIEACTVCALDRHGPDTAAAMADLLARYPEVDVAAVDPVDLRDVASAARRIASLLRPDGVLVQDVQLETLACVPPERWWESIYVAATVRGLFGTRLAHVRFISNKRGYEATFGRDLLNAGFDPRDVMDKSAIEDVVVPTIARTVDDAFPWVLRLPGRHVLVADHADDRRAMDRALDLVVWVGDSVTLSGRLIGPEPVSVRVTSHEATTWMTMVGDRLEGGQGVPVIEVGRRVAPAGAERAEMSSLAARHVHGLRARLADASAVVTAEHRYRLRSGVRVGLVVRQPSPASRRTTKVAE